MTANQARDLDVDLIGFRLDREPSLSDIDECRKRAIDLETQRRKDPAYVKCPRCYGAHTESLNFGHTEEEMAQNPKLEREKLCNRCTSTLMKHFPGHASVPYIVNNLFERGVMPEANPEWNTA